MKKEVFLAISIGFILGLVITFGIWTANKSLRNLPASRPVSASPTPASDNTTPPPTDNSSAQIPLTLTSPENEALVENNTLTVSGTSAPQATIAVLYELGEQLTTADPSGKFQADIRLEGGYNRIIVTAFNDQGQQATQNLIVTYTTAKL